MDSNATLAPLSGFTQHLGIKIVEWREGFARLSLTLRPELLNTSDSAHGGVLATLVDQACSRAGSYRQAPALPRRVLTLSLNINYSGRAAIGEVYAEGHYRGGGNKVFFADACIVDANGDEIAFGSGTMRYRS
jgi:uncharacterized protein (TIGR00369 family)